jgi:hypothetical protein
MMHGTNVKRKIKKKVTLSLQALDTHFLHAEVQAFTPQWYKFLIVSGDHAEVWCVPSAAHNAMHRSESE